MKYCYWGFTHALTTWKTFYFAVVCASTKQRSLTAAFYLSAARDNCRRTPNRACTVYRVNIVARVQAALYLICNSKAVAVAVQTLPERGIPPRVRHYPNRVTIPPSIIIKPRMCPDKVRCKIFCTKPLHNMTQHQASCLLILNLKLTRCILTHRSQLLSF